MYNALEVYMTQTFQDLTEEAPSFIVRQSFVNSLRFFGQPGYKGLCRITVRKVSPAQYSI